ncbi:MAG: DNA polymerase [Pseudanabaena sp.]
MYYFITAKAQSWNHPEIEIVGNLAKMKEAIANSTLLGCDTENNSINPINATPLLFQISDGKDSFVVDITTIGTEFLKDINFTGKKLIFHNAQYDWKILNQQYGVSLDIDNIIDTMIHEQILGRGSGRSASLEETHFRRLNAFMPMSKSTRDDFIKMKYNPKFQWEHIYYSAYDPICLFPILEKQKPLISQYKLERRVYEIGDPLVPILGEMCVNGFTLDSNKWLEVLNENKSKKFQIELKLDEEIVKFSKDHPKLKGGLWTNKRKKVELEQLSFFGQSVSISNENKRNVSYSSTKQLVKLFTILGEPIPQKQDREGKEEDFKAKKNSFAEEALEQYKIEYPSSKVLPFINKLLEYRKYEKAINSFGEIFLKELIRKPGSKKSKIGYYNSKTGKVHTIYKQEFTKNGRLSSGDVKNGFYNSQQIIKDNKYRNCFTLTQEEIANGWYVSTYDLSSAELVILASNSRDKTLIKLLKEKADLHCYLASAIYTKIISYIKNTMSPNRAYDEIAQLLVVNRLQQDYEHEYEENGVKKKRKFTYLELSQIHNERIELALSQKEFKIDKKKYPDIRNPVKNIVYGINYGAGEEKVAETLNIAPYYAKLALEAMRESLPEAFAYLDRISNFGVKNGYLIFNERTNSRHWFETWLDAQRKGIELSQKDKSAIKRACKNYGISGTQADMIKESMVNIHRFVNNQFGSNRRDNFRWLLQVHDEIVFAHKANNLQEAEKFAKQIGQVVTNTCNLYLNEIEMEVSGHTGHCWHKD